MCWVLSTALSNERQDLICVSMSSISWLGQKNRTDYLSSPKALQRHMRTKTANADRVAFRALCAASWHTCGMDGNGYAYYAAPEYSNTADRTSASPEHDPD